MNPAATGHAALVPPNAQSSGTPEPLPLLAVKPGYVSGYLPSLVYALFAANVPSAAK